MATNEVFAPFEIFPDIDGDPLESGFVYIGTDGLNPEVSPVSVYWDEALSIPAAQPIRTIRGYLSRSGSPGRIYVDAASFSITVRNKNGSLIYSSLSVNRAIPFSDITGDAALTTRVDSVAALIAGNWSENLIQIASYYGSWVNTTGPEGSFKVHKTGATNAAPTAGTAVPVSSIGGGDGTGSTTGQIAQVGYFWSADGAEWKISERDEYHPEHFGADESFASNYVALTDGIAFCAANYVWLHVTDGKTFFTDQTLDIISHMYIKGSGTIKLAALSNVRVFDNGESPVVQIEDVKLKDFTIDGNRTAQTALTTNNDGIKINFCDGLYVDNLTVKSCGTPDVSAGANNAVGLSLHECINFRISNCRLSDCQHYNMQVWESVDGVVEGNISTDPGSHCFGGAANLRVKYVGNTASIIWSRSNFTYDPAINAGQGLWFRQYEDCVIADNTVYRQTDGVSPTPAGAGCQNGNEPSLTPTPQSPRLNGILTPNQSVNGTIWANNTVVGDFEFGIYAYSGAIEKTITDCNTIDGCWSSGLIVTSGRLISSGDVIKNSGQSVGSTITNITQANPAVVTSAGHPYTNGQSVYIANVVGMTEVNGAFYTVANVTTNTFELSGIDSSAFTAYTSGGIIMTTCAAVFTSGRDHKISAPFVYNAESNGICIQGVRSTVVGAKIEGYGQSIPGSAISIRNFSNDCMIGAPEIYTDTPATQSYAEIWFGDDAARVNVVGGTLSGHPAANTAIRANNRTDHNVSNVIGFAGAGGQKYRTPQRQGIDYFWVDATGDYRIKSGSAPTSDTDGTVIGTQT